MKTHVVESGDTLFGIAKKYGITVAALQEANANAIQVLSIGQHVRIPTKEEEQKKEQKAKSEQPAADQQDKNTYVVRRGDSLYKISRMFEVSIEAIMEYNGLESYLLQIGQRLGIPPKTKSHSETEEEKKPEAPPAHRLHEVVVGDSLFRIANQYQVTINDIRRINHLDSNLLSIGQHLLIPSPENTRQALNEYSVKHGDTLSAISERYHSSVEAIKAFNRLESDRIYVGQLLYIPSKDYAPESQIQWDSKVEVPGEEERQAIEAQRKSVFRLDTTNGVRIFGEGLKGAVGEGLENQPEDLEKLRKRLQQLRLLSESDTPLDYLWTALKRFQERYHVGWWAAHPVWGKPAPAYTPGAVYPDDMTYRLLREHTSYRLSFEDHEGELKEARFTNFPRSRYTVYPYGVSYVGTAKHKVKASFFKRLGLSRILAEALEFVSSNEGNYDAINTYDRAIFSFGFIQFAGQSVKGTLPQLLAFIKKYKPELFQRTFRRFGVDVEYAESQPDVFRPARLVVMDPTGEQGLVALRGREAEEYLRANKSLYGIFIRAGHNPEIAKLQIRAAIHFYVRPAVGSQIVLDVGHRRDLGSEYVRDIIRSSAGLAMLIDLTVNRGLSAAIKIIEEAIEAVADQHGLSTIWQIRNIDERKILRYLRRNHADPILKRRANKILDLATREQEKPQEEQLFSFFKRY